MATRIKNAYAWVESSKLWRVTIDRPWSGKKDYFFTDDQSQFIAREHVWTTSKGYAKCTCHGYFLHRLIARAEEGDIIEFFNKDPKCVTKRNLRVATRSQIRQKQKPKQKAFDIPVPGVEYKFGKWEVRIKKEGQWRYIARFEHLYDAICCRIRNEYLLYGEDSHNYRHLLKRLPRYYLLKWLPEIYSHMNPQFIGSDIYRAHYKGAKNTPPKLLHAMAEIGKEDI